jgi:ElaB/YqjD/DUF883 family membrane-anchored ribosome-binding protein
MKNRIPAYLSAPRRENQPTQPAAQELPSLAQKQIGYWMHKIETYVQTHPVTGIGAAFCIGIFLGWIIKRR